MRWVITRRLLTRCDAQRDPVRYIHRCDVLQPAPQQLRIEARAGPGVQRWCCRAFLTCVSATRSRCPKQVEGTGFLYRQARCLTPCIYIYS